MDGKTNKALIIIQTFRPPFLVLTPICLFLAISLAKFHGVKIDVSLSCLILLTALCAHISVNTLNEYLDFKSGLDLKTQRTPFSGGSGTLPMHPELAVIVMWIGLLTLGSTVLLGLYFVLCINAALLWLGILGVAVVAAYTTWLNRSPLLCLIAPGVGFSTVMVLGTYLVFSMQIPTDVLLLSLVPFFQINNLLLLNQFPDIDADKSIGRSTFPIRYGTKTSSIIYAVCAIAPYWMIFYLAFNQFIPQTSLIATLTLPLALFSLKGALTYGSSIGSHSIYLATNVACTLLTPLILAISLFSDVFR
ncbi:prenyltransferase [Thalassotalea atypica]|uniref:prenyltransferase n=1 Tax=Thalassotalea atypica TaxID=2054316 RepID=UPI0025728209|nr:prenyltransferase [Thalassotalea atypica]